MTHLYLLLLGDMISALLLGFALVFIFIGLSAMCGTHTDKSWRITRFCLALAAFLVILMAFTPSARQTAVLLEAHKEINKVVLSPKVEEALKQYKLKQEN